MTETEVTETVETPLLQLGQRPPPHPPLLWDFGECSADPNLDRRLCMGVDRDCEEGVGREAQHRHDSRNPERQRV